MRFHYNCIHWHKLLKLTNLMRQTLATSKKSKTTINEFRMIENDRFRWYSDDVNWNFFDIMNSYRRKHISSDYIGIHFMCAHTQFYALLLLSRTLPNIPILFSIIRGVRVRFSIHILALYWDCGFMHFMGACILHRVLNAAAT